MDGHVLGEAELTAVFMAVPKPATKQIIKGFCGKVVGPDDPTAYTQLRQYFMG
jgi:hypothetical protein